MNSSQNPLEQYFFQNRRNIIHKWTHYFEVYHRYFQKFVGEECVVLEIACRRAEACKCGKTILAKKPKFIALMFGPNVSSSKKSKSTSSSARSPTGIFWEN